MGGWFSWIDVSRSEPLHFSRNKNHGVKRIHTSLTKKNRNQFKKKHTLLNLTFNDDNNNTIYSPVKNPFLHTIRTFNKSTLRKHTQRKQRN